MAHKFKAPKKRPAFFTFKRTNQDEYQIRRMAAMIKNQEQFDAICAQFKPQLRTACAERLIPYLSFTPVPIDTAVGFGEEQPQ